VTNPLPDWYVKEYPHAIRPDGQRPRRAGASIYYAGRLEYGSSARHPVPIAVQRVEHLDALERVFGPGVRLEGLAKAEEVEGEHRAASRLLRLELWWMRVCLGWTARPGFRLVVLVPTV